MHFECTEDDLAEDSGCAFLAEGVVESCVDGVGGLGYCSEHFC